MSAARFEIVQTDAEQPWHARRIAGNGRKRWASENFVHRRAAVDVIEDAAQHLIERAPDGSLRVMHGRERTEVRYVDERPLVKTERPGLPEVSL